MNKDEVASNDSFDAKEIIGEVESAESSTALEMEAKVCGPFTLFSHHATSSGNLVKDLYGSLTGMKYESVSYNNKLRSRIRQNKIKNRHNRFYKSHAVSSQSSRVLLDNAAYVMLKTPNGWGGGYSVLVVTRDGTVYRAKENNYMGKIVRCMRATSIKKSRLGLLEYVEIGHINKEDMADYPTEITRYLGNIKVVGCGFDAGTTTVYKRVRNSYRFICSCGDVAAVGIYESDVEKILRMVDKVDAVKNNRVS